MSNVQTVTVFFLLATIAGVIILQRRTPKEIRDRGLMMLIVIGISLVVAGSIDVGRELEKGAIKTKPETSILTTHQIIGKLEPESLIILSGDPPTTATSTTRKAIPPLSSLNSAKSKAADPPP